MDTRRVHPRIEVALSADVQHAGRSYTTVTRNVSVGGCCLEARYEVPEGDELAVSLFLVTDGIEDPTVPALKMKGRVAWSAPGEDGEPTTFGVRFEGLSASQLEQLSRFMKASGL